MSEGDTTGGVSELRLVLTVDDVDATLEVLRDRLGMPESARFEDGGGTVVLLSAGRAAIEVGDRAHADHIDRLEVGREVPTTVRVALHVADTAAATASLVAGGVELVAAPRPTPWGSVNARLLTAEGVQLTLFDGTGES